MEQIPVLSESGAWDEDAQCPSCAICDNDFSAMRRRHHCRKCGQIICSDCSTRRLPVPSVASGPCRVCNTCYDGTARPALPLRRVSLHSSKSAMLSASPSMGNVTPPVRRLHDVQMYPTDAFHGTSDPRPRGTCPSMRVYNRVLNGVTTKCICKADFPPAAEDLIPESIEEEDLVPDADLIQQCNRDLKCAALKEICANDIYAHYGCHAQTLGIVELPWPSDGRGIASLRYLSAAPHLVMDWIAEFHDFRDCNLLERLNAAQQPEQLIIDVSESLHLPVVGLGRILAVALFLNDTDCLGNSAGNVGFTIITNEEGEPAAAQAIKIDPGCALTGGWSRPYDEPLEEYETNKQASLVSVQSLTLSVGNGTVVSYLGLPASVQSEFLAAVKDILATSPQEMRAFFDRNGMELVFEQEDSTPDSLVAFLVERQAAIRAAYSERITMGVSGPDTPKSCVRLIKLKYERDAYLTDPVTGERHSIDAGFVNLSLLEDAARSDELDSGAVFAQGRGLNSVDALRGVKVPVAMKDIFVRCGSDRKHVNVRGSAGFGKSTCCQSIVSQWAAGELFAEFELVVLVPLRHLTSSRYPTGSTYDILDVIARECLDMRASPTVRSCLQSLYNPVTTLWILDGYDEIVDGVPLHLRDVVADLLSAPNRVLTGRPHAMQGLHCDVEIDVVGFSDDNVRDFVQRFVAGRPNLAASPTFHTASLFRFFKQHCVLWDLAHVPITLALMCHVLTSSGSHSSVVSLVTLYRAVEALMMRRYCKRQGLAASVLTPERIASETKSLVTLLSGVAFDALAKSRVMIPGRLIVEWMKAAEFVKSDDAVGAAWRKLMDAGVIVRAQGDVCDPSQADYTFLHLTVQEYYAAQHVQVAAMGDVSGWQKYDWLLHRKYAHRLEVMWWFAAGLARTCAGTLCLESVMELWFKAPRDIGKHAETQVTLRMVEESRLWEVATPGNWMHDELCQLDEFVATNVQTMLTGIVLAKQLPWINCLKDCPLYCRRLFSAHERLCEMLHESLNDARDVVRLPAVNIMEGLGAGVVEFPTVVSGLYAAVTSEDPDVVASASKLLSKLDDAAPRLPWLSDWLAVSFQNRSFASCELGLTLMRNMCDILLEPQHRPLCDMLCIAMTCNKQNGIRAAAISVLTGMSSETALQPWFSEWLLPALQSGGQPDVIVACLGKICDIGGALLSQPELVDAVMLALSASHPDVVQRALTILQSLEPCDVDKLPLLPWLESALKQPWDHRLSVVVPVLSLLGPTIVKYPAVDNWLKTGLECTGDPCFALVVECLQSVGTSVLTQDWLDGWIRRGLDSPNAVVRDSAVTIVTAFGADAMTVLPWLTPFVQSGLRSLDETRRQVATSLLSSLGPRLLDFAWAPICLRAALFHCKPAVSRCARAVMVHTGSRLLDEHPWGGRWMLSALIGDSLDSKHVALEFLDKLGPSLLHYPDFTRQVFHAVKDPTVSVRLAALKLLSRCGPALLDFTQLLVPSLCAALHDSSPEMREEAVAYLRSQAPRLSQSPQTFDCLEAGVTHPDQEVRCSVFGILKAIGPSVFKRDNIAVAVLTILTDDCLPAKVAVVDMLRYFAVGLLRYDIVVKAVSEGLSYPDFDHRALVLTVLQRVGPKLVDSADLQDAFETAIHDENDTVRGAAIAVLRTFGPEMLGFPWLMPWLRLCVADKRFGDAVVVLESAGPDVVNQSGASELIESICRYSDADCLRLVRRLGAPMLQWQWALAWLLRALSGRLREEAVGIVESLGVAGLAIPDLVQWTADTLQDPRHEVMQAALDVVRRFGPQVMAHEALVAPIRHILATSDVFLRWSAQEVWQTLVSGLRGSDFRMCSLCFDPLLLSCSAAVASITLFRSELSLQTASGRFKQQLTPDEKRVLDGNMKAFLTAPPSVNVSVSERDACEYIQSMAVDPGTVTRGTFLRMMSAANAVSSSERVFTTVCAVVVGLCGHTSAHRLAAGCRVTRRLKGLYKRHAKSLEAWLAVLEALAALCRDCDENAAAVLDGEWLSAFLKAIRDPLTPHACVLFCDLITALLACPSGADNLHNLQVCDTILRMHSSLPGDPDVQQHCCLALAHASAHAVIRDSAAIPVWWSHIQSSLRLHPDSPQVCTAALQALHSLCLNKTMAKTLVTSGVHLRPVFDAMRTHKRDEGLVTVGVQCVARACAFNSVVPSLLHDSLMASMVAVLRRFEASVKYQSACWHALAVLAEHASSIVPRVSAEDFAILCASLDRHIAVVDVQASGGIVLSWLCQDDTNATVFMDQEALAHMLAAMHAHPLSESVQLGGLKLLRQLSLRPQYKSGLLRSRRVHGVTARAIAEHAENAEIQQLIDASFGLCMGVHLETITVPVGVCNGIALSSDGAYMAVSDHYDGSVALFSMPKAIFLRRFGSKGSGPDQCNWVFRVCFVPGSHNVLVCDKGNNRIQEYDITGTHVRCIPVQWPKAVACDGKVIVVGSDAFGGDNIAVFDYTTAASLKTFGVGVTDTKQRYCSGLCLSGDGSALAVAETRGKLSLIDRDGATMFRKGDGILTDGALDVAFGSNNSELVLCDPVQKRIVLYSRDGEECLNVWTSDWLAAPTAVAVFNGRLYVVSNDGTDSTVEVFR